MKNEQENFIERPDLSVLKSGQRAVNGNILDEEGNVLGLLPTKRYPSHEAYMAELKDRQSEEDQPELLLWEDLNRLEFPDDVWLVKNFIPKYGLTILASISGEGKTWLALELARCIATGKNFLDQEEFKTNQAKVLYIDAENSQSEIQRRGRQLSLTDTDQLLFKMTDQLNLNSDDGFEELEELVKRENIKVLIIDTFRAVAGGLKEEKAEEVREFFNRFKILKNMSVSIIWLDHYRKPNNFEGRVPKKEFLFGSQDKTANVEILIMMKKEENEIFIYQRKNRLGKEIEAFKVVMRDETNSEGITKTAISYAGGIDEKESKKDLAKEYIPEILKDGPKITPEIKAILYKEKKISERNVGDALRELVSEKVIGKRKRGRPDEFYLIDEEIETNQDNEFNAF